MGLFHRTLILFTLAIPHLSNAQNTCQVAIAAKAKLEYETWEKYHVKAKGLQAEIKAALKGLDAKIRLDKNLQLELAKLNDLDSSERKDLGLEDVVRDFPQFKEFKIKGKYELTETGEGLSVFWDHENSRLNLRLCKSAQVESVKYEKKGKKVTDLNSILVCPVMWIAIRNSDSPKLLGLSVFKESLAAALASHPTRDLGYMRFVTVDSYNGISIANSLPLEDYVNGQVTNICRRSDRTRDGGIAQNDSDRGQIKDSVRNPFSRPSSDTNGASLQ